MNPDSENFEKLRQLLTLKRYEVPPPGYFEGFSRNVIARIKAGERGEEQISWAQWLWGLLESRPVVTGSFAAAFCGLMVAGFLAVEDTNATVVATPVASETAPLDNAPLVAFNQAPEQAQITSSTNPVTPSLNSLFDQFQLHAQPASFPLSSGH